MLLAPRRTSGAVLPVMFSLALVVAFAGMASASYQSIVQWLDTAMNPDLFIMPSQRLDIRTARFPATMGDEIAAIDGVARVQRYRDVRVNFRGKPVMVAGIEMSSVHATSPSKPVAGERDDMYARAATGSGVIISDNLAQLRGLKIGDTVDLAAPYGTMRLPVVGVIADYTVQQGTIFIDRSVFVRLWRDETVNDFRVFVAPEADAAVVRQRIIDRYAGHRHVFVLANEEARGYVLRIADRWFGMVNVQIGIAVLIAILGIVNALTVSIADRRRELGVLKAVGALRGQIRRTIWLEAVGVAVIGLVLGSLLGAVMLRYLLDIVQRDAVGMRLDYQFPIGTVVMLIPLMIGAAIAAALGPSEAAVRGSLVEALEYE
jgi:putative ABC transport system permease protein